MPSNYDYAFRAGLFIGDYDVVAYPQLPGSAQEGR